MGNGLQATGAQTGDGFVVFEKSQASIEEAKSTPLSLRAKRQELIDTGILCKSQGNHYTFTRDFTFGSPSTAAGVVQGMSVNGRTAWKDDRGVSIKELEKIQ